jgi:hypothetical protein
VVCDPERQAHQLFALKRIKGRFGRQEYRFVTIVLAIGFSVVLSSFQKTAEMEFKTEGVRL